MKAREGKKFFFLVILLLIIVSLVYLIARPKTTIVEIKRVAVKAEVADTDAKRFRGLSGRRGLDEDHGMIFIFDEYQRPGFVMRKMKFSIDILWVNDDKIIDISENLLPPKPDEDLRSYYPVSDVNYVIEVPAYFTEKYNIMIGDKVSIPVFKK